MRFWLAIAVTLLFAGGAEAANRFWIGGTGTWDNSGTAHWATTSGGGTCTCLPAPGDAVTFDAASGGGVVTVAAAIDTGNSILSLSWGNFTGTLDFDTNNVAMTITGSGGFAGSGTGTRKFLGAGSSWLFTINTSAPSLWSMTTTTNLYGSSDFTNMTITYTATTAFIRGFLTGGLHYGTFTVSTNSSQGGINISGNATIDTLNFTGPGLLSIAAASTVTITNAFAWTVTGSAISTLISQGPGVLGTIHASAVSSLDKFAIRDITFNTSAVTATNSYDLGDNAGVTITAPAAASTVHALIVGGP